MTRPPPNPVSTPDFSQLRTLLADGLADAAASGTLPKDFRQYVYEAALEAAYGNEIWAWMRVVGAG